MDSSAAEATGELPLEVTPVNKATRLTANPRLRLRPAATEGGSALEGAVTITDGDAVEKTHVDAPRSGKKVIRSTSNAAARLGGSGGRSVASNLTSNISSPLHRSPLTSSLSFALAPACTNAAESFTTNALAFTGVPGFTLPTGPTLGDEIPRNVQDLLQAYFQANNTTTVPSDIYCVQVPRVHLTTQGKPAIYTCHLTNEVVQVKGYKLPSMKKKQSERLLVAAGRAFTKPIVLARTKSHSNEFRIWNGASDTGTGPAVVSRSIPNHGKKAENRKRASSTSEGSARKKAAVKRKESVNVEEDNDDARSEVAVESHHKAVQAKRRDSSGSASYHPSASSSPAPPATSSDNLTHQYQSPITVTSTLSTINTPVYPAQPPDSRLSLAAPAPNNNSVENNTVFQFVSNSTAEVTRTRTLSKCNNVDKLFTHAYAANTLTPGRSALLEASIESRNSSSDPIRIVDEDDFDELVQAIVKDACWDNGEGCLVLITAIRAQNLDEA